MVKPSGEKNPGKITGHHYERQEENLVSPAGNIPTNLERGAAGPFLARFGSGMESGMGSGFGLGWTYARAFIPTIGSVS